MIYTIDSSSSYDRGVLGREKFADLVHPDEVAQLLMVLSSDAVLAPDPAEEPGVRPADPDDDYLIAFASHTRSVLISGAKDLLDLSDQIPVYSPAGLWALIRTLSTTAPSSRYARSSVDVEDERQDLAAWLPGDGDMTTRLIPNSSPRRSRLLWPIALAYVR